MVAVSLGISCCSCVQRTEMRNITYDYVTITICSIVERKVGVYKEIVEGDNNL